MDLATMLAPMEVQAFTSEVWGRRHLHLRRGRPFPPELVGMGDVDFLISTLDLSVIDRLRSPIRLRRGRSELFAGNLARRDGRADLARVHDAFCQGYSVVLDRVHTRLPSIWSCVRTLEAELGTKVVANLYLTPAHSLGFQPHFDTLEVFVLQIEGAKRWQVYAPLIELPRELNPQAPVGVLIDELVLQPGEPDGQEIAVRDAELVLAHAEGPGERFVAEPVEAKELRGHSNLRGNQGCSETPGPVSIELAGRSAAFGR